jgi:hypothetical protein
MMLYGLGAAVCFVIALFLAAQEIVFRRSGIDHPLCGPRRAVALLRTTSPPAVVSEFQQREECSVEFGFLESAHSTDWDTVREEDGSFGVLAEDAPSVAEIAGPSGTSTPAVHRSSRPEAAPEIVGGESIPSIYRGPNPPETPAPVPREVDRSPDRVVYIEASSNFQVGEHNVEYLKYRVRLPKCRLKIDEGAIRALLSGDASSLKDAFNVQARTDVGAGSRSGPRGGGQDERHAYGEDTLIIVKRCSNFQIGDHNTLKANIDVKVMDFSAAVGAIKDDAARAHAAEKLIEKPTDQKAIRSIAKSIADSARLEISAEVTAHVNRQLDKLDVHGFDCTIHHANGFQVGPYNQCHRGIEVDVGTLQVDRVESVVEKLARERAAARLKELRAVEPPTTRFDISPFG